MNNRYSQHYHILGIGPETTWEELRQVYKSLVNIWHPDRFQQDGRRRKLAEEKTKEITQSYHVLAEYYKNHGTLPRIVEKMETPPAAENIAEQNPAHTVTEPKIQDREPAVAVDTPSGSQKQKRFKFPPAIAAAALAGTAYFITQIVMWESSSDLAHTQNAAENPPKQVTEKQKNENTETETPKAERFFTVGATLGEVYAIQGVPTKTENNVWYYGQSKVYFANSKVVSWEENRDSPLRTHLNPADKEDKKMRTRLFGKGSSKTEVLAVQGAPDRDADDVWDYGVSRVYFENGHVKGWDESPLSPLKVRP